MTRVRAYLGNVLRLFAIAVVLGGCGTPLIGEYSLEAYKNATTLKAQTAALIDKSGQKFTVLAKEVEAHTTQLNSAYEFVAGLPNNQVSARQWQILLDPNGGLYGEFVNQWRTQGTTSVGYRTEKKRDMDRAFNYIICLEANKQETQKCAGR